MKRAFIISIASLVCFLGVANASFYNVIDLGQGKAYSINNKGQAVGNSGDYATLFDTTGGGNNINLGTLGGTYSVAYSINNNGQIVGKARNRTLDYATFFDATGGGNNRALKDLDNGGCAYSINDNGQIVGISRDEGCRFIDSDECVRLYWRLGSAYSINNNGQIVGKADNGSGKMQACIFNPNGGNVSYLGTLDGSDSVAYSINDQGQIVGCINSNTGYQRATLFEGGSNIYLGNLDGSSYSSIARSINNLGQIVGCATNLHDNNAAAMFDLVGNQVIDLNTQIDSTLGWELRDAYCINDNGWIVGYGLNPQGVHSAFLLVPTPEPCTLLLLGLGGLTVRQRGKVKGQK